MAKINLVKGEEIISTTKRNWIAFIPTFIACLFLIALGIGGGYGFNTIIVSMSKVDVPPDAVMILFKVFVIFIYVAFITGGVIYLICAIVSIKCDFLVLTNKRMYGRKGVIAKQTFDIVLEKIDTVNVVNTFAGAIFHYSKVEIVSPASSRIVRGNTVNIQFKYIANAEEFRKDVIETLDKVKNTNQNNTQANN